MIDKNRHVIYYSVGLFLVLLLGLMPILATSQSIQTSTDTMEGSALLVEPETYIVIKDEVAREDIPITVECHNLQTDSFYRLNSTFNSLGETFISTERTHETIKYEHDTPADFTSGVYITVQLWYNESIMVDSESILYVDKNYYGIEDLGGDNTVRVFAFIFFTVFFIALPAAIFEKMRKR